MNPLTTRDTGQQAITPMGSKLANIRMIRNGVDTERTVRNEINRQQQLRAQQETHVEEALRRRTEEITVCIANSCNEVDAISPQDVVADHLTMGTRVVTQVKNTQNTLFLAIEQGEARLEREKQEKAQLEKMLRDYEKQFRSAGPKVPQEEKLLLIGKVLSQIASGGL